MQCNIRQHKTRLDNTTLESARQLKTRQCNAARTYSTPEVPPSYVNMSLFTSYLLEVWFDNRKQIHQANVWYPFAWQSRPNSRQRQAWLTVRLLEFEIHNWHWPMCSRVACRTADAWFGNWSMHQCPSYLPEFRMHNCISIHAISDAPIVQIPDGQSKQNLNHKVS